MTRGTAIYAFGEYEGQWVLPSHQLKLCLVGSMETWICTGNPPASSVLLAFPASSGVLPAREWALGQWQTTWTSRPHLRDAWKFFDQSDGIGSTSDHRLGLVPSGLPAGGALGWSFSRWARLAQWFAVNLLRCWSNCWIYSPRMRILSWQFTWGQLHGLIIVDPFARGCQELQSFDLLSWWHKVHRCLFTKWQLRIAKIRIYMWNCFGCR